MRIREACVADAFALAPRLRAADVAEAHALGLDPAKELVAGVIHSHWTLALEVAGVVEALFGVREVSEHVGAPWLLGSDELPRQRRALQRYGPVYIAAMLDRFPLLENVVHAENAVAIRWLRRAGFTLAAPVQIHRGLFHPFRMSKQ